MERQNLKVKNFKFEKIINQKGIYMHDQICTNSILVVSSLIELPVSGLIT